MKNISDALAIGGNALSLNEFMMHILVSMYDAYESLVTNVLTRLENENITVEDMFSVLSSHEIRLKVSNENAQFETMHDVSAWCECKLCIKW